MTLGSRALASNDASVPGRVLSTSPDCGYPLAILAYDPNEPAPTGVDRSIHLSRSVQQLDQYLGVGPHLFGRDRRSQLS